MELYVHNWTQRIGIVSGFQSLRWTRVAQNFGEFCLRTILTPELAEILKEGYVIEKSDDDDAMMIEDIRVVDAVNQIISCSGRSCGAVLDRRSVWPNEATAPPMMNGTVLQIIGTMLDNHAIKPADPRRILPVAYEPCDGLPADALQRSVSWRPLGNAVVRLAQERGIGLRSVWRDGIIAIVPYPLSYNSEVFSKARGTIATQDRFISMRRFANFAIVAGEGEFPNRAVTTVGSNEVGLQRFERYVNASHLRQEDFGSDYINALRDAGMEALLEAQLYDEFMAEIRQNSLVYKKDYDVGQIVPFHTERGQDVDRLISEITETYDENGVAIDCVFAPVPIIIDEEFADG